MNWDLNQDGKVNILDVICLLLAGCKNPEDVSAVDYNGDGTFSLADAVVMLMDILSGNCTV